MREMSYYEHPLEYKKILDVKKTATLNKSLREGMGSMKQIRASLDMLNFLPAQLYLFPLDSEEPVNTSTTIGKRSKKPILLETPIMISGMSFGALNIEQKIALAKASTLAGTATNTGEGVCSTKSENPLSTSRCNTRPAILASGMNGLNKPT